MKYVIRHAQYTCVQIKYAVVTQCIHKVLPYIFTVQCVFINTFTTASLVHEGL